MTDWQPISTAPRDGTVIQIYNGVEVFAASWDSGSKEWPWAIFDPCQGDFLNGIAGQADLRWKPMSEPPA